MQICEVFSILTAHDYIESWYVISLNELFDASDGLVAFTPNRSSSIAAVKILKIGLRLYRSNLKVMIIKLHFLLQEKTLQQFAGFQLEKVCKYCTPSYGRKLAPNLGDVADAWVTTD